MKNYTCYENNFECWNEIEIVEIYQKEIDKKFYPDFECWLHDMLKLGILIESVN